MSKEKPKTNPGSHRATLRGYADGKVIEPGQPVPAGTPISTEWMERADGAPFAEAADPISA